MRDVDITMSIDSNFVDDLDNESIISRTDEVDFVLKDEIESIKKQKKIIRNTYVHLETQHLSLDAELEKLIENPRLSSFQILDEMVEKLTAILEDKGVVEFDLAQVDSDIDKWIPRKSIEFETPPEFAERVYGGYRGITRADIQYIDARLYKALNNWEANGKSFPENFSIPKLKDQLSKVKPSEYHRHGHRVISNAYKS